MSLQQLFTHFSRLYGNQTNIYLRGVSDRILWLLIVFGDLQRVERKGAKTNQRAIALARIVSRYFTVANIFPDLPLAEMMARKFPLTGCSYCNNKPCICVENRPNPIVQDKPTSEQLIWGLKEWSAHLQAVYGMRHKEKGFHYVQGRLIGEITEVCQLALAMPHMGRKTHEVMITFAEEMADLLSWIIGIANLLEIDLEAAVLRQYGQYCPNCRSNPCECEQILFKQVDWSEISERTTFHLIEDGTPEFESGFHHAG